MSTRDLFERNVVKTADGCWLWTGSQKYGYGRVMIGGVRKLAHRWAFEIYRGESPDGLCVCHTCDVPLCVNPDHLFLGTRADNVADMDAKKRRVPPRGERNAHAKLSAEKVRAIRSSHLRNAEIARQYDVSKVLIGLIKRGAVWGHVQ